MVTYNDPEYVGTKRTRELLRPHDEFGYLSRWRFAVRFDSKENFDRKYDANWFYYFK